MKEEIENNLIACLGRLCRHFNFENNPQELEKKQEILNKLEAADTEIWIALKEYFVLYDSYIFIKSDRSLILKGRDIWKIELSMFGQSLVEANNKMMKLLSDKGIM
jgi:hypothetical protein